MRAWLTLSVLLTAGCPPGAYSKRYEGVSDTERKALAGARRDVYPDDVRDAPEQYRKATLAWPGIVLSAHPEAAKPDLAEVVIAHHYWDWIEDHSIQKAKAFLSARGEGEFVCHVERVRLPAYDINRWMAIAYVRPVGVKDGELHTACLLQLYPPDWYLTDVFEYGRDGEGFKILRVPMK